MCIVTNTPSKPHHNSEHQVEIKGLNICKKEENIKSKFGSIKEKKGNPWKKSNNIKHDLKEVNVNIIH